MTLSFAPAKAVSGPAEWTEEMRRNICHAIGVVMCVSPVRPLLSPLLSRRSLGVQPVEAGHSSGKSKSCGMIKSIALQRLSVRCFTAVDTHPTHTSSVLHGSEFGWLMVLK